MSKRNLIILSTIFFLASALRVYKFDQIPSGMTWDEAAIGYNGFSVWEVHRDEWLHFMPISFQSFGDFKAPFAIYLNGLFTFLFGLNIWAIRLPFILTGLTTLVGTTLLVALLLQIFFQNFRKEKWYRSTQFITIFASLIFISFSPWHFHFSRAGFESGMALNFVIWGINGFLFWINSPHKKLKEYLSLLFSVCCLTASLYTYHSAKIVVPGLLILFCIFFYKKIWNEKKAVIGSSCIGLLILLPLFYDTFFGKGATRLSQTSIFGDSNTSALEKISTLCTNFLSQFSPRFLFFGETTTLRHGDGHWGVLYLTEGVLIISTIILVLWKYCTKRTNFWTNQLKITLLSIGWICIGFLPTSIGTEIPHANRSLLALPGFIILDSVGVFLLSFLINTVQTKVNMMRTVLSLGLLLHMLLAVSYFKDYFTHFRTQSADAFTYGYKQVFDYIIPLESSVDKILITNHYGQPYIYALLFRKTNPILYNGGSLIKYEFTDAVNVGDLFRKNAILVATPKELDPSLADQLVLGPDGDVRFVIVKTDP